MIRWLGSIDQRTRIRTGIQNTSQPLRWEPTDARRAFPCFDEPAPKAEYTITFVAYKHYTCLSNMDPASEKETNSKITGGKRKAVFFNRSPLMSTYLCTSFCYWGSLITSRPISFAFPSEYLLLTISILSMGRFSLELVAKTIFFL